MVILGVGGHYYVYYSNHPKLMGSCSVFVLYINGNSLFVFDCVLLLYLNIMFVRVTHSSVAVINFHYVNIQLIDIWVVSSLGAILNYSITNIVIHVYLYTCAHIFSWCICKNEIAYIKKQVRPQLDLIQNDFPNQQFRFILLSKCMKVSIAPIFTQHTIAIFSIFVNLLDV